MKKPKSTIQQDGTLAHLSAVKGAAFENAASELVAEARQSSETFTRDELYDVLELNQMVGITHYARTLDAMNKLTLLRSLQKIKESKAYRKLSLPGPNRQTITVNTWQQLCDTLGLSRSKVDEDLLNLAAFGEDMLKAQDSLGIGYRELRGLRGGLASLPEGERAEVRDLIANAAASGDREELLATLDEVGARNSRLSQDLAAARSDAEIKDRRIHDKSVQIDDLQTRLEKLTNPAAPEARAAMREEQQRNVRQQISLVCNRMVGNVTELCRILADARNHDSDRPDALPVMTDALWRELDERIGAAWRAAADLLAEAGLDSVAPVIDAADFAEADPDAAFDAEAFVRAGTPDTQQ